MRTLLHRFGIAVILLLGIIRFGDVTTDARRAGSIGGRITSASKPNGLVGTVIHFYKLDSDTDGPFAMATTDGMGFYNAPLPAGEYAVLTQDNHGYINQIWEAVSCSSTCNTDDITVITVEDDPLTNINFLLVLGSRVEGTITRTSDSMPIAGILVAFVDESGELFFTTAITDATGHYLSEGGMAEGTIYITTFNHLGYQDEAWDNVKCLDCDPTEVGAPIAVASSGTLSGIDFALDQGGTISGTVTNSIATPLANVTVHITTGTDNVDEVQTDALGHYSTTGLPAGTYYAYTTNSLGLVDKLYNNVTCPGGFCNPTSGQSIGVMTSSMVTGIDFVLSPGGKIAGTVTAASSGLPIEDAQINIFNSSGSFVTGLSTDEDGNYETGALPAGNYFASTNNVPGFSQELYNNIPCPGFCNPTSGTAIPVVADATTGDIDFALSAGGTITGTVTNLTTPGPVTSFQVQVFSSTGSSLGNVNTDGTGFYTISGLPTGSYYVRTNGSGGLVNELYNDVICVQCSVTSSGGTLVAVTEGVTTPNINFGLNQGGRISGTITSTGGMPQPIQSVNVQVFTSGGTQTGNVSTNAMGQYTTFGLPAGNYYVRTSNTLGYVNELWDNIPCPQSGCNITNGTAIAVVVGMITTNKHFALDQGGQISGTITNADGGAPLQNVSAQVFSAAGTNLGSTSSDSSGNYLTSGLPAGTYYVRTFNTLGFVDELYDNIPCVPSCTATTGTAIAVVVGATTSGKNFALGSGGSISGTVKDSGTTLGIASVSIQVYTAAGLLAKSGSTDGTGAYTITGLTPGTYYAKTGVPGNLFYFDELFEEMPCAPSCTVTTGTAIVVVAGMTQSGKNFTLTPGGGAISGTVKEAGTLANIQNVNVQIYASNGSFSKSVNTNSSGFFSASGLAAGTYYARTQIFSPLNYVDQLYTSLTWPCVPSCPVTTGTAIVVADSMTSSGVAFVLTPSLIQNGQFASGTFGWTLFGAPDQTYLESDIAFGTFRFRRIKQTNGTPASQGVIFQETGQAFAAGATLVATFDLGSLSNVRKYMKVLLVGDAGFSDLAACTFWFEPGSSTRTYRMKTHTTKAWTNATLYFYASSPKTDDAYYYVDNVTLAANPGGSTERTDCIEPSPPGAPGGEDGDNLLTNGDFSSGVLSPWTPFGTVTVRDPMVDNVLEMKRPTSTFPAGVVLQATGEIVDSNQPMTATLRLGNSTNVRRRALLIAHDNDFSDLVACTWWLEPLQAMSPFALILHTSKQWTNATVSVYPSNVGTQEWLRVDDVSLRLTPDVAPIGSECLEGSLAAAVFPGGSPPFAQAAMTAAAPLGRSPAASASDPTADTGPGVLVGGTAPSIAYLPQTLDLTNAVSARMSFESWLTSGARAEVQVSTNGGRDWITVGVAPPSDGWLPLEVDLREFLGEALEIRFAHDGTPPDEWRIRAVRTE